MFQTLGGGIMAASPVSDLNALFVASGASVTVVNNGMTKIHVVLKPYIYVSFTLS